MLLKHFSRQEKQTTFVVIGALRVNSFSFLCISDHCKMIRLLQSLLIFLASLWVMTHSRFLSKSSQRQNTIIYETDPSSNKPVEIFSHQNNGNNFLYDTSMIDYDVVDEYPVDIMSNSAEDEHLIADIERFYFNTRPSTEFSDGNKNALNRLTSFNNDWQGSRSTLFTFLGEKGVSKERAHQTSLEKRNWTPGRSCRTKSGYRLLNEAEDVFGNIVKLVPLYRINDITIHPIFFESYCDTENSHCRRTGTDYNMLVCETNYIAAYARVIKQGQVGWGQIKIRSGCSCFFGDKLQSSTQNILDLIKR